ncbi:hypothetical protein PENTCL1PPCAC_27415, partial [Pristionchus entomophagus]
CIDSLHYGLRCEHTKCSNENSETPCESSEKCAGPNCPSHNDICESIQPCLNDGICTNTASGFHCACSTGFSGSRCENDDFCSSDSCNNGYCLDSSCICDSGWTGAQCDIDIDECSLSPCAHGSTCLNKNGSFQCICPPGRNGLRCESGTCTSHRECINGGHCINGDCICQPGFDGPNCEREYRNPCFSNPCSQNKHCLQNRSEIIGFSCACPPETIGRFCEYAIHNSFSPDDQRDLEKCSLSGCSALAKNGICNEECNHFACGFDGGDCSAGTVPFARCPYDSFCSRQFKDGRCDEKCNNENCLFDGFDCLGPEPEIRKNGTWTDIRLISLVNSEIFMREIDNTLNSLVDKLKTSVRMKKTERRMDVFEWNSKTGEGPRVDFGSRTDARVEYIRSKRSIREGDVSYPREDEFPRTQREGILFVIQVDLAECSRQCFSDANAVSLFIGATEAKAPLNPKMKIYSAEAIMKPSEPKPSGFPLTECLIVLGLMGVGGIGVVAFKRRKIMDAPVWTPPSPGKKQMIPDYHISYPVNEYNQFPNFLDSSMPTPVFKSKPRPITVPASNPLELAAYGDERVGPEMRRYAGEKGRYGRTSLHWLALNTKKSSADIIYDCNYLISFGVDLNVQDMDGNTALHCACANGQIALVSRLLEVGADPSIDNEDDMTPLHVAAKNSLDRFIQILLEHKFYKDKSKLELVDVEDRTALMLYAANSCHSIKGAELLLKAGADVNYSGDKNQMDRFKGRTALHHAAHSNKDNHRMIEFLVAKNANKDAQDVEEATPLFLAVDRNNYKAVDQLLKTGASLEFPDQMGRFPRDHAMKSGYMDILERLRVAGLSSRQGPLFPSVPSHQITDPRPKKRKTPIACTSYDKTPSPAGLKASGPSCLDSPHSDQGRMSAGVSSSANSSSEISSPSYTPAFTQQPLQQLQQPQLQPFHQLQLQPLTMMRPSPPYDDHNAFMYPSLALPPLSNNQLPY